jgi:hypothetical protein
MRRVASRWVLLSIFLAPGRALARDSAAAEALYRAAKELAKKGDWAKACPQFAESQRLDPAPGTLMNLADCEEHEGRLARAWGHFIEVEPQFKSGDSRRTYAHDRAAALEKRVPRLIVRLDSAAPPTAIVLRDDEELKRAALGVPLPVDPGAHVVLVRVGENETRASVQAVEGQTVELVALAPLAETGDTHAPASSLPLPPSSAPAAIGPRPPPQVDSGSGSRTVGWGLVLGGAGATALGVVTGALALTNAARIKEGCGPDYATCTSRNEDDVPGTQTLATVSTVAWVAGAALLVTGLYFVLRPASLKATPTAFLLRDARW